MSRLEDGLLIPYLATRICNLPRGGIDPRPPTLMPGQVFLAHQGSEKDDSMIGTLVVTLPSSHTGGELVIRHLDEKKTYRSSKTALSLVAFYADCRHEVRERSGYPFALTYNLLVGGGRDGLADQGARLRLIR